LPTGFKYLKSDSDRIAAGAKIPHKGHRFKPVGHWSFQSKTLPQFLQVTLILAMRVGL